MLTPKNIKAKTAVKYFKQGYYQKGKWLGKGAASLGLKGEIKNDVVYENIVNGLTPDGSKRLNRREVQQDRRKAAVDCTFAAPKSVSLCALVGNDERLILAHERAVEKVLEQMEAEYAQSRVMLTGNQQEVVKTQNMVIAKYDHIESRELDPHLHSHCLVMNMTQLPNGEWYSHLNDEIFRNQKLLGMKYQHYLALEVQKLGYEIEQRSHGQFDIKGYSESDLNDFSKRRMQILGLAGVDANWTEREKAWKKTRKNKENVSPEELKALWREEAAALGLEIVKPGMPRRQKDCAGFDEKIFADAIKYCSERRVAFKAEDIQAFILSESRPVDITTIEPLISNSDELIRIEQKNGCRYTTITAVERELATINLMREGIGRENAIASREVVEQHLAPSELNFGQRQAVMMTLTSSNSFVAWQGVAGAGKTFALKQVKEIAQAQGYTVKGFAPSAKASKVLGEDIVAQTQTVARLLAYKSPDVIKPNQLWIVDEAGLLSAIDAYRLFQKANIEKARVILVGDTRQLSAIESGNPFKSLQQAGIETAYLNESQRQKNAPALKLAIDLLAVGRVIDGIARLNEIGSIQKVSESTKTALIVKAYFQAPPEERAKTLVLAGTNEERLELTKALRIAMQTEGSLGSDVTLTQLKAKDLREVQLGYTSHFAVGDMVMPLRNYKRKGLEKGELYQVVGKTTDTIKLRASDGKQLDVSLDFKKAVYQREEISIAVGDRLMWKKNNYDVGLVNGAEVTVKAIDGNVVEVVDKQGLVQIVDLDKPQHLDHAIVRTTYSSQGESADRVLVAADSTIGRESFYVAASRARYDLRFYTTDENKLLEWAQTSRAQENPLELIENQVKQLEVLEPALQLEQKVDVPTSTIALPVELTSKVAPPVKRRAPSVDEPSLIQTSDRGRVKQTDSQPSLPPEPPSLPPIPAQLLPSTRPIPKEKTPNEPFFSPQKAPTEPSHIEEKHWRELVEGSAINPILAAPNIRSLRIDSIEQSHEAWEYLMYSGKLERTNTGQLSSGIMKRYTHIEAGGWWAESGVDALDLINLKPGEKPRTKLWGSFKPDNPRIDVEKSLAKGQTEYIKYEHPLKEERSLFLFDVPDTLAQRIYDKYGIEPTEAERQSGFWYIVHKYNLPITLAEGAKKTLSSLSQGEITIGLSGVNGGYFARDNDKNKLSERFLHPELKVFATSEREFKFAFDADTKQSTIWNVRRDMVRTGELLELLGSKVRVVQWQADKGKGLDDLIVSHGPLAYTQSLSHAIPLSVEATKHYRASYNSLANKVRNRQPRREGEAMDIEIYKLAINKGDTRDGARTIAQSDQARQFKATMPEREADEKTLLYTRQIEKLVFQPTTHTQAEQLAHQSNQNQSNETDYDINIETDQPELTNRPDERNRTVERVDCADGSKLHQTDSENQFTGEQSQQFEREVIALRSGTNPEFAGVEDQSYQLLAAISGYIEQQEIEQLGADIARINQSLTSSWLPGRGAAQLTGEVERQDSTSLDSPTSHGSIEQLTSNSCCDAISHYLERVSVEAENISPSLADIANNLQHYNSPSLIEAIQELDEAIEGFLLQQQENGELDQTQSQVIDAISNWVEVDATGANISQDLESLTGQIAAIQDPRSNVLLQQFEATIDQLQAVVAKSAQSPELMNDLNSDRSLEAVANYIEYEAVADDEVAIALSNLKTHLDTLEMGEPLKPFETKLSSYLQQLQKAIENTEQSNTKQAIDAISNYCDRAAIDEAISPSVKQVIKTLADRSKLPEHLEQIETAIEEFRNRAEKIHFQQALQNLSPQVFMGSRPQPHLIQPIQNYGPVYKPIGGMWTSPHQPQYGSEWSAFVHKEGMTVPEYKQQLWLVVPKPDLKILVVDSPEKLKSLPHLQANIPSDNVHPIDYEALAQKYDALVIKPQFLRGHFEVATFDVESTIWFATRGYPFVQAQPLKLPFVSRQSSQPIPDSPVERVSSIDNHSTEQSIPRESENLKNLERWKSVATALGKPVDYINRIAATREALQIGASLPDNAAIAWQQDFQAYQQRSDAIAQWYKAAIALGKSEQYLSEIQQVARAFHDPSMPEPISSLALSTMQRDIGIVEQQKMQHLWQRYSLAVEPVRPMMKANAVALAALNDGYSIELIYKILKHDPQCAEIRQRSGEGALQKHISVSVQNAVHKLQRQNQSHQVERQLRHKQKPQMEL